VLLAHKDLDRVVGDIGDVAVVARSINADRSREPDVELLDEATVWKVGSSFRITGPGS
jgi:hypothetical protein